MDAKDLRDAFESIGPLEVHVDGHRMLIRLQDGRELSVTGSTGSPITEVGTIAAVWNALPAVADLADGGVELTDPGVDSPKRTRKAKAAE